MTSTTETLDSIRTRTREAADARHARFPQYLGHWDGAEWRVVAMRRNIRTKLGVAFVKGEGTIAKVEAARPEYDIPKRVVAYSVRNGVDTIVGDDAVEWLE